MLELFQETALQKKILCYRVFKMIVTGLSFCGQWNWTSQKRAQIYVR